MTRPTPVKTIMGFPIQGEETIVSSATIKGPFPYIKMTSNTSGVSTVIGIDGNNDFVISADDITNTPIIGIDSTSGIAESTSITNPMRTNAGIMSANTTQVVAADTDNQATGFNDVEPESNGITMDTVNDRIEIEKTGVYYVWFNGRYNISTTTATVCMTFIQVNGATVMADCSRISTSFYRNLGAILLLQDGDLLTFWCRHTNSLNVATFGSGGASWQQDKKCGAVLLYVV